MSGGIFLVFPMVFKNRGPAVPHMQLLAYLLMSLSLAFPALSQNTGQIIGVVKDPDQAVVSGSQVILTNQQAKSRVTAVTDSQGAYTFASVPTGAYVVEVDAT